jgi:hypothetical protein
MDNKAIRCLLAGALAWAASAEAQGAPERCLADETEAQCEQQMALANGFGAAALDASAVASWAGRGDLPARAGLAAEAGEGGSGAASGGGVSETARPAEPDTTRPGVTTRGEVKNSITGNAIGLFMGDGVNADYARAIEGRLAGVVAARFSRTDSSAGQATKYGFSAGADYFLLGRNNEGLRVGPRLNFDFSTAEAGDTDADGGRLGAAAEAGYNWISTRGLTAQAALGWEERLAGAVHSDDDGDRGSRDGAYVKVNLGYSW